MSHENQHKNLPRDQAKEGDQKQPITSAKAAAENITDEPQAPSYEVKFHSFSSSSDSTATTSDDQPLLDLIRRVTGGAAGNPAEKQGKAVSEFAIEDAANGVVHTHRGAESIGAKGDQTVSSNHAASGDPAPRQSFLDGLKKIFDHASSPEEREQMQSAFSIDYMMRKAKEFIGDVQSLITGKPVAVEKLPYDASTDVQPLPFRPGEKDSQPVEMIIRERMSPDEPEAARSLGVQITEAVIKATGADAYKPSAGTLPMDVGGDTAEDKSAVPPRPPRPGEEDARQLEEMIIRQQMSPGETESLTLGGQFAQAAIDATGADAYNPNAGTLPIDSAGRPSTAEDRSTVRPHPPSPGEEDARREEMIIRQQLSPGETESLRLGGQFAQAAIDATGADAHDVSTGALPFRPGIDDDRVETLPYKPGDNDQPVQQIIREVTNEIDAIKSFGTTVSDTVIEVIEKAQKVVQGNEGISAAEAKETPVSSSDKTGTTVPGVQKVRDLLENYIKHPAAGESSLSHTTVAPGLYQSGRSEQLIEIARHHLPSSFTKEQQESYVKEIVRVNKLNPALPTAPDDQGLLLPGHKPDGSMIVSYGGDTVTTDAKGGQKIVHHDGRTITLTRDGEQHDGPGPADKFLVQRGKDGTAHFFEKNGEKELKPSTDQGVKAAHKHLHDLYFQKVIDPQDRLKIEVDMARFEQRARDQHLPPETITQTYKNLERILNAPHGAGTINERQLVGLAKEVLSQAGEPRSISQGHFKTCQVTAIEYHMYREQPAEASRLVADMALTGKFKASDGTSIDLNDGGVLARNLNTKEQGTDDGERTLATQLFNATTINLVYQKDGSGKKYTLEKSLDQLKKGDTGERLYDKNGNLLSREPGLNDDQIVIAYRILTSKAPVPGTPERGNVWNELRNNPNHDQLVARLRTEDCPYICNAEYLTGEGKLVAQVHSEKELTTLLQALKEAGKLPVMLGVHTANEPFYTDSDGEKAGGAGGGHVVTITDFQNPPGVVSLDNQWKGSVDHRSKNVSISDLYLATLKPQQSISEIQRRVDDNRLHNHVDTALELDLVRLKHCTKQTDDTDYGWDVAKVMTAANVRWEQQKKNGTFNPEEQKKAMTKLNLMRRNWKKDSERAYGEGDLNVWDRIGRHGRKSINDPET